MSKKNELLLPNEPQPAKNTSRGILSKLIDASGRHIGERFVNPEHAYFETLRQLQRILIIGPPGGGKTTIADALIGRFLEEGGGVRFIPFDLIRRSYLNQYRPGEDIALQDLTPSELADFDTFLTQSVFYPDASISLSYGTEADSQVTDIIELPVYGHYPRGLGVLTQLAKQANQNRSKDPYSHTSDTFIFSLSPEMAVLRHAMELRDQARQQLKHMRRQSSGDIETLALLNQLLKNMATADQIGQIFQELEDNADAVLASINQTPFLKPDANLRERQKHKKLVEHHQQQQRMLRLIESSFKAEPGIEQSTQDWQRTRNITLYMMSFLHQLGFSTDEMAVTINRFQPGGVSLEVLDSID